MTTLIPPDRPRSRWRQRKEVQVLGQELKEHPVRLNIAMVIQELEHRSDVDCLSNDIWEVVKAEKEYKKVSLAIEEKYWLNIDRREILEVPDISDRLTEEEKEQIQKASEKLAVALDGMYSTISSLRRSGRSHTKL